MKSELVFYKQLHKEVDEFFDVTFPELINEADQKFNKPLYDWLKSIHKELISVKKDDSDRYYKTILIFERQLPTLKQTIHLNETYSRFELLLKLLQEKIDSVPAVVIETQSPDRFNKLEDDSAYVSFLKFFKRWRKPESNKELEKKWTQRIPVRKILSDTLVSEPLWIETWMAESFRDFAEILEMLLEKSEPSEGSGSEEEDRTSYLVDVIKDLESQIEKAIMRIETDEMLNNHELSDLIEITKSTVLKRAEKADTVEGERLTPNSDDVLSFSPKQSNRFQKLEESWTQFLESQFIDLNIQNEIALYGHHANVVQGDILEEMHTYFRDYAYIPMEKGVAAAKEIAVDLEKSKSKSLSAKLVNEIRKKVDLQIKDAILAPMQKVDQQQKTLDRVRDKISKLQMQLSDFSEKVKLAEKRKIKIPIPELEFDELNWQSLATRFLQDKGLRQLQPEKMQLVQFIKQKAVEVEETIQIVDVNLMAAIESKQAEEKEEESPLEIAVSGMERAVGMFEQSIKSVREKQNEYEAIVKVKLPEALHQLEFIMLNREYDKFELQDKALQVKERATDWKEKALLLADKWVEKGELAWRFLSQKFKKVKAFVLRYLGFQWEESVSISEKRGLTEYLIKNRSDTSLPFIYRRLFDTEFNIDWRFYVPPSGVFQSIEKAFDEWQNGIDSNILLTGEKGSGKSTAVRFSEERLFMDHDLVNVSIDDTFYTESDLIQILCKSFGFKDAETKGELIEKINNRRKRSVFIVENLHNAYIRNIHGFEALDSFMEIMSATREKLFWVVSTSRYSWEFFVKKSGADQYFSYILEVDTLDKDQLRKAILSRHKSTGYNLIFEPGQTVKNSRAFRKLLSNEEEAQNYLREYYFTRLSNISEGNLSIAIIFWLQSISEFDDNDFRIAPLEVADVDKLEAPARDVLFTLAAFVTHDRLTDEEMALALHQDVAQSRLMLTRLKSKGIIYKTEHGYNMNQLVYRQVIRLLKRRNIIH